MKYRILIFLLGFSIVLTAQQSKRFYTDSENRRMMTLLDSTHNELLKVVKSLTGPQFFYHIDTAT
jgi:hypothetical protein